MIADTKAAVAEVQALPEVGDGPLGYWGLSMGTIFRAAVRRRTAHRGGGFRADGDRHRRQRRRAAHPLNAAPHCRWQRITMPVLMLMQWSDELVPWQNGLALFDALASTDKRLHINPGRHAAVPREEFDHSVAFLSRTLGRTMGGWRLEARSWRTAPVRRYGSVRFAYSARVVMRRWGTPPIPRQKRCAFCTSALQSDRRPSRRRLPRGSSRP